MKVSIILLSMMILCTMFSIQYQATQLNVEKNTDITNEVLQAVLKGETVPVIRGTILFELYNIVGRFVDES
ncbi:hypothetical protein ECHHL_0870 [Ehrlichia chaffeensis str. Heartland]|uniref:Uncharacterized protein n=2 Tax=Ehrlichia chaffeensis TaxID=945 RepID=Q2GFK9_EHRCR|nr:hypothetical protein [Ehrlichia chaffeensis]ABD44568.1 hypothetical protein ECH_0987 [Ehrlichia chaffeensis str. Arkansas]AHX08768.1 hypothetical protein ECHSTV_0171 [Ehrlichia chaffeensis str. Saint Vincent]AHX10208.1 hypothetical protein ECHWP_0866 [Ehrlichia chaffeensis str. West Paces]AHX04004.1 hypothetical protein ECHHL_0870 [Ehrlichia chaffeensis str. Heartland]AHX07568.1 hypothetical protein ECHOSC_0884 [Ehrlichia chaffeensis str. Osceola]